MLGHVRPLAHHVFFILADVLQRDLVSLMNYLFRKISMSPSAHISECLHSASLRGMMRRKSRANFRTRTGASTIREDYPVSVKEEYFAYVPVCFLKYHFSILVRSSKVTLRVSIGHSSHF